MPSDASLRPTSRPIQAYYDALRAYAGQDVTHETAVRSAFQNLPTETGKTHGWTLIPELPLKVGSTHVTPDGTLRDEYHLRRGYWEAKDTDDNLAKQRAVSGVPWRELTPDSR